MPNPFVHHELNTPNLRDAKTFYGEMFGWQFQDMEMGPAGVYSTFTVDSGAGGGMVSMPTGHPGWLNYVGVADIHAATEKARALGATILLGPQEIPGIGSMTILTDPCGCTIAIFEPQPPQQ